MFYYDAHCHIQTPTRIKKAMQAGIQWFVCNGTHPDNWDGVLSLAKQFSSVIPCLGVHPWFIDNLPKDWFIILDKHLMENPLLMVGEIGLDTTRPDLSRQAEIFENCLKLAQKHQRPVHIHGYKTWDMVAHVLKCFPDVICLLHRYTGNEIQTRHFESMENMYFSVMTHKPTTFLPKDKILIESDAPDGIRYSEKIISMIDRLNLDAERLCINFKSYAKRFSPLDYLINKTTKD